MPDSRSRRGAHPKDPKDFGPAALPLLETATFELSWLLSRGYPMSRCTTLVGDRHALRERQRKAIGRGAASRQALELRRAGQVLDMEHLVGREIWIDGYNVLLTVEAALGGGVLLRGNDGVLRDMAAMSSHFKRVDDTVRALELIGAHLARLKIVKARWLLDRPISNSGRLRSLMLEIAGRHDWDWAVELVANPDNDLKQSSDLEQPKVLIASADSAILESGAPWLNLASQVVGHSVADAWIVDLSGGRPRS